ncbi:MAG: segregation/condensation protein A [bacterium]|nr:segregation/condensation protein A [bacterium]
MSSGNGESGDASGPNPSEPSESQTDPAVAPGDVGSDPSASADDAGAAVPEGDAAAATAESGGLKSGDGESESTAEAAAEEERVRDPLDNFPVSWLNSDGEPEQGPMYVLWELIESYKVDIFEVSLHRITEDFLHFLQRAGELQVELASSFTVMASRLLYYKSRALLPDPGFEESDDETRLPPELVQQLLEYRKFQFAAERLGDLDETSAGMLTRKTGLVPDTGSADANEWLDVSLVDLIKAYSNVLERAKGEADEEEEDRYEVEMEEHSVEDKIVYLRSLLVDASSFAFEELFENIQEMSKVEIVATFLALLELTRQGEIILRQKVNFGEIRIFKKSVLVR